MGRAVRRALIATLVLLVGLTPAARAADDAPPLEDVVMQGRILRPDGSPLANTPVRVDTDSGTPFFNFFVFAFSAGTSLITCFERSAENDLCPIPSNKSFFTTTDANGHYSFTFPKAKRRGQQTNTDYFLSVAMRSRNAGGTLVTAQYELELLTPVHNAPDVVMWDPAARVVPHQRSYELAYDARSQSKNSLRTFVGDDEVRLPTENRTIEARDLEDTTINLVPYSSKDERAEGTIYHQRFTAAAVTLRGALVPLSRGAACTVVRKDGSRSAACGYTDGDVVHAATQDANPCQYDGNGKPYLSQDVASGQPVPCQPPVTEVTVDLGTPKAVGEVRGCACTLTASADGAEWFSVVDGRSFGPRSIRYVRATGSSLDATREISIWPSWPDAKVSPLPQNNGVSPTPLATSALPPASDHGADDRVPILLGLAAAAILGAVVTQGARELLRRTTPN